MRFQCTDSTMRYISDLRKRLPSNFACGHPRWRGFIYKNVSDGHKALFFTLSLLRDGLRDVDPLSLHAFNQSLLESV